VKNADEIALLAKKEEVLQDMIGRLWKRRSSSRRRRKANWFGHIFHHLP